MFEELEPVRRESDGRLLKRFRLKKFGGVEIPDGPICTEDPMDQLIHCELVERKPLELPKHTSIFFMDYSYGSDDPEGENGEDPCE
jgi:hypothetical protein